MWKMTKDTKQTPTEKKSDVIRQYERRWIKPTLITLLIIGLPLLFFGFKYGPNTVRAMSQHDAPFNVALHAARRSDSSEYFENTPHVDRDPIITTAEELPDGPTLVLFYLHHCPYCEVAYQATRHNRELLEDKYGDLGNQLVYVEVNSPLGMQLLSEHDIQVASSMLLLAEHEEDNLILGGAKNDSAGQPARDSDNILKIFRAFDKELEKQLEHQMQRERIN